MSKIIVIQKRLFIKDTTECVVCEHKFKFLLPAEIIPFWDNYCTVCSALLERELKPGEIKVEAMWDF